MLDVVLRKPTASVDEDSYRMRARTRRQSQFAKLKRIFAIGDLLPGRSLCQLRKIRADLPSCSLPA